ncbi:MAG: acyl-CoA dehydrogenase [Hyphomicrobiaceae bacterium]|nr:MAG: acyl-CoA dehydrogenase [Hyphomicrobiaceae bacterium]
MDFSLPPELAELQARVRSFIVGEIIPLEEDPRARGDHVDDGFRRYLNAIARKAGLLAPQAERRWGGLGLSHLARAVVFEEAGYSPLGPVAMHLHAPDEGNMHLLETVATEEQKQHWLKPLAGGEIRSAFLMTEPDGGAGADPDNLRTTARRDGTNFVINGRKWLITGGHGAALYIIMARMAEEDGATMFLADADTPGIERVREISTMAGGFTGGHAEVKLENVRVGSDAVLGEVGKGFAYAQVRLVPARLTHCMRWLGAARRAHDIAAAYARQRWAFGARLVEHQGVGFQLADNEIDLHMARLAIWHVAWLLDRGERANAASSMVKVFCSEAEYRVADRALQVLGGLGVTTDTRVEAIFRGIRAFRIYDGPSEVHRWALARRIARTDRAVGGARGN